MYRLAYGRVPKEPELRLAREFLQSDGGSWKNFGQVLLSSNEFLYIP